MSLKARLLEDIKTAMKAREQARLGALRLMSAAIKQREIDERIELDDTQVLAVLEKMCRQRRESIAQYRQAGRQDLVDQEQFELDLIAQYLPEQLDEAAIAAAVAAAVAETGASGIRDMATVMALLRSRLQGQADMGAVGRLVKERLGG